MKMIKETWNDPCTWALFTGCFVGNITLYKQLDGPTIANTVLLAVSFYMWIKKKLEMKRK